MAGTTRASSPLEFSAAVQSPKIGRATKKEGTRVGSLCRDLSRLLNQAIETDPAFFRRSSMTARNARPAPSISSVEGSGVRTMNS